jgi:hypothetical protein
MLSTKLRITKNRRFEQYAESGKNGFAVSKEHPNPAHFLESGEALKSGLSLET